MSPEFVMVEMEQRLTNCRSFLIVVADNDFAYVEVHYTYLVHILTCTDPDSVDCLTFVISSFLNRCAHRLAISCLIVQDQLSLRWYATLMGFLHESLIQLQHRYYKSEHSRSFNVGKKCYVEIV